MSNKGQIFLFRLPLFIVLFPLFFVLHGFTENYDFVSINDFIGLLIQYLGASFILFGVFFLVFRHLIKAAILAFLVMAFHFFFGSIYDGLHSVAGNSFITKYSVLLSAALIIFVLLIVYLRKKKQVPLKLNAYLNIVLMILLLIDLTVLLFKHMSLVKERREMASTGFITNKPPATPDIYFIVLDEYAGSSQLSGQLGFDNSDFLSTLEGKHFHVVANSISNYASTPYSVASFLTMDYLDFGGMQQAQNKLLLSYRQIRKSAVVGYLSSIGYEIDNYSIFDLPGKKSPATPTFLPTGKKLITSQTFLTRIEENLGFHLYTTLGWKMHPEKYLYIDLENNNLLYDLTNQQAAAPASKQKFVYTHLMMPHYPYYFTKEGRQRPINELMPENKTNQQFYLDYLAWCNQRVLALVSGIQTHSPGAVIILVSDHGFRAFDEVPDKRPLFSNLCAVYLPSQKYKAFYDGISPVNVFRALFNTQFGQHLPMLKDSCMFDE